jgi:hypothetical protein
VLTGILNTGIASGIPIIKNLFRKGYGSNDLPIFVDCPPGVLVLYGKYQGC